MEFTRKLRQSTCILFNIFLVLKRKPIGHAKKSTKNYFKSEISPLNSKRMSLFFADSGSLLTIYEWIFIPKAIFIMLQLNFFEVIKYDPSTEDRIILVFLSKLK